jgi:hypothetical protein
MQRKGGPRCFSARFAATSANPWILCNPGRKKRRSSAFCRTRSSSVQTFRQRRAKSESKARPSGRQFVFQNRRTIFSSAAIQSGCSFRHGICANSFPPADKNVSRPRMPISSSVSRQSDTNDGQMTRSFLTSALGQFNQFKIRVRFQPWVAAKPGLERNGTLVCLNTRLFDKGRDMVLKHCAR